MGFSLSNKAIVKWLFYCLLMLLGTGATVQAMVEVTLNPQEREYIFAHPIIKVGIYEHRPPYSFIENGQTTGYSHDLIRLLATKLGLEVEFVPADLNKNALQLLHEKQVDVIASLPISKQQTNLIYTHYHPLTSVDGLMIKEGSASATDLSQLSSIAVVKNSPYHQLAQEYLPSMSIKLVDSFDQALDLLLLGKVDALLDAYDYLNYQGYKGKLEEIEVLTLLDNQLLNSSPQFMAMLESNRLLRDLLDKALLAVSEYELAGLKEKWSLFDVHEQHRKVSLFSERERLHLKEHGKLKMCVDPNWLPIEGIENGQYIGIGAEIIELFKQRINIPIELVETKNWNETLHFMQIKRCDFIPLISRTEKREQYLAFTSPYLSLPMVMVTNQDNPKYLLHEVLHKPLATFTGNVFKATFEERYPNGDLREFATVEQGLDAVNSGEVYGYIDTLPVIYKQIHQAYPEIKIADKLDFQYQLSLAVPLDQPVLLDIFNKVIASIEVKQRENILNSWLPHINDSNGRLSNNRIALIIIIVAVLVSFLLMYLLGRARATHKHLQQTKLKLEQLAMRDLLTGLPNQKYFKDQLKKEWERSCRSGEKISLLLIDIDHFKYFNQQYGKKAGDDCLVELARRLQSIVKRPADVLVRYEGEEFAVLLPDTNEQGIKALTAEIYYMVNSWRLKYEDSPLGNYLTVTIGAACMSAEHDCPEVELYRRAERALYRAQDRGYNQMVIY